MQASYIARLASPSLDSLCSGSFDDSFEECLVPRPLTTQFPNSSGRVAPRPLRPPPSVALDSGPPSSLPSLPLPSSDCPSCQGSSTSGLDPRTLTWNRPGETALRPVIPTPRLALLWGKFALSMTTLLSRSMSSLYAKETSSTSCSSRSRRGGKEKFKASPEDSAFSRATTPNPSNPLSPLRHAPLELFDQHIVSPY